MHSTTVVVYAKFQRSWFHLFNEVWTNPRVKDLARKRFTIQNGEKCEISILSPKAQCIIRGQIWCDQGTVHFTGLVWYYCGCINSCLVVLQSSTLLSKHYQQACVNFQQSHTTSRQKHDRSQKDRPIQTGCYRHHCASSVLCHKNLERQCLQKYL